MKLQIIKKVKIILMKTLFLSVSFASKITFSKGIRKVIQTSETNLTHRYKNNCPKSNQKSTYSNTLTPTAVIRRNAKKIG